ncbi:hypothetical protein O181_048672 [Austropuccinia psidii MF-1]|uniref:Reverse transcriptase Ty1/copia-type domain-containing protein n=1 Tax=Austropuccinia psidii MF-1 TaxID=1389203 RepID=A0A9Q3DVI7_9BASI|nr:hypothetical protein [Austropuccinia psidii MF-1]
MHVDNGLVVGDSRESIETILKKLSQTYKLKISERPNQHLGYTLEWNDGSLTMHQEDFCKKILDELNMFNSNPIKTPTPMNLRHVLEAESPPIKASYVQKAIGMLSYLALHTRLDIVFTVNVLSQHVNKPISAVWQLIKHVLRYLKGTSGMGIKYTKDNTQVAGLIGWADADYANSTITRKSTSGYVITLFGNPVSWSTKKQSIVAQSTTEAEFVAVNKCAKQVRWMSSLLTSIGIDICTPVLLNDNAGAVFIAQEAKLNSNSKHIEIRFQYVRDLIKKKLMKIAHISTQLMIADILTEPLATTKLTESRKMLKMIDTVHINGG